MYTAANDGNDEARLDTLLRAYRDAVPEPEPSSNFMPGLWQKIEARQKTTLWFGRLATSFVTAAVALTVVMALFLAVPRYSAFYGETYVDVLASDHQTQNLDYFEPVHIDTVSDTIDR
jgi:hypothetical protein